MQIKPTYFVDLAKHLRNQNAKQKHLGCKKVRGQEGPATKSSDIK